MNCQICGQAPATRLMRYDGSAGKILACGKKAHDASARERRELKTEKRRLRLAERFEEALKRIFLKGATEVADGKAVLA